MPGPGRESGFQSYCGAEFERVYALALEMIRANTRIDEVLSETLARRVAAAHCDAVYEKLTNQEPAPPGA